MPHDVSRRHVLRTGLVAGGAALAGCAGTGDTEPSEETDGDGGPELPEIEDPPNAVYLPTHFEAMRHLDPVTAGDFELLPMVTYPHRFWNITGDEVEPADPEGDDVHLMVAVRDSDSGMVLPVETGLQLAVGREGESKTPHAPWPMISQEMGFHFGDNIPLDGDSTYEVDVTVGGIDVERTGTFTDRFADGATGTFTFEFDEAFREAVAGDIEYIAEDERGQPGALEPMMIGEMDGGMEMDRTYGTDEREAATTELPPADALPGTLLGTPTSDDAVIATTVHDADSRFVDEGHYLSVSPRTPYNRGMLPLMTIDATVDREGEADPVIDTQLTDTIDHELGYHYALRTADSGGTLQDGDTLTLSFPSPPQVSRHQGYETAFLEMEPVELTVTLP